MLHAVIYFMDTTCKVYLAAVVYSDVSLNNIYKDNLFVFRK